MSIANKPTVDPVFEELYPNTGPELDFVMDRYPEKFPQFKNEYGEIRRRAGMTYGACIFYVMNFALLDDSAALYASIREKEGPQYMGEDTVWLRKRERVLKSEFTGKQSHVYMRAFAAEAADNVGDLASDFGKYGKIEIYSRAIRKLDTTARQMHKTADLQIDLIIKSVLRQEPNRDVRKFSLLNAGVPRRDTLVPGDLFIEDSYRASLRGKSI